MTRICVHWAKKLIPVFKYLGVILLVAIVALSFSPLLRIPGNFKSLVVLSGSMEPSIKTGSVVAIKPQAEYAAGDIVTFKHPTGTVDFITHRIESVEPPVAEAMGGESVIKTKGDANNAADSWEVSKEDVEGKVLFSVPYLGYAVNFAKTTRGFLLLIILPAVLIILGELMEVKREMEKGYKKKLEAALEEKERKAKKKAKKKKPAAKKSVKKPAKKTSSAAAGVKTALLLVILNLFSLTLATDVSLALFSDAEISEGNTITVGVWAGPGDVVINEVMWMGSSSGSGDEWLELRNTTGAEIDISGWVIENAATSGGDLEIPSGRNIPADGYFLIANNSKDDSAIDVDVDWQTTEVSFENKYGGNGKLVLKDERGNTIDSTPDPSGDDWPAGDNGDIKKSMERNTRGEEWHTCKISCMSSEEEDKMRSYWDSDAQDYNCGTPGNDNLSRNDPTDGLEVEEEAEDEDDDPSEEEGPNSPESDSRLRQETDSSPSDSEEDAAEEDEDVDDGDAGDDGEKGDGDDEDEDGDPGEGDDVPPSGDDEDADGGDDDGDGSGEDNDGDGDSDADEGDDGDDGEEAGDEGEDGVPPGDDEEEQDDGDDESEEPDEDDGDGHL